LAQCAALTGRLSALRALTAAGAALAACHPERMLGGCCLHAAALGSHPSVVRYLLEDSGFYGQARLS
jgi:hypothetical protein